MGADMAMGPAMPLRTAARWAMASNPPREGIQSGRHLQRGGMRRGHTNTWRELSLCPAPDSGAKEEAGWGQEDGGPEAGGQEVGGEGHEHREGEDPPQVEQHQRAVSPVEGLQQRKHLKHALGEAAGWPAWLSRPGVPRCSTRCTATWWTQRTRPGSTIAPRAPAAGHKSNTST